VGVSRIGKGDMASEGCVKEGEGIGVGMLLLVLSQADRREPKKIKNTIYVAIEGWDNEPCLLHFCETISVLSEKGEELRYL
jgi:hypothetical protein